MSYCLSTLVYSLKYKLQMNLLQVSILGKNQNMVIVHCVCNKLS